MSQERIVDKIKALLARAHDKRNNSEHERNVALRKAQELMDEHSISVSLAPNEDPELGRSDDRIGNLLWRKVLFTQIGLVFGTKVSFVSGKGHPFSGGTFIYGRKENRETTIQVFDYINESIRLEWDRIKRLLGGSNGGKMSFCLGAATAVQTTCQNILAERQAAAEEGAVKNENAIILYNHYELLLREANELMGETTVNRSKFKDVDSPEMYAAGYNYGSSLNIGKATKRKELTE